MADVERAKQEVCEGGESLEHKMIVEASKRGYDVEKLQEDDIIQTNVYYILDCGEDKVVVYDKTEGQIMFEKEGLEEYQNYKNTNRFFYGQHLYLPKPGRSRKVTPAIRKSAKRRIQSSVTQSRRAGTFHQKDQPRRRQSYRNNQLGPFFATRNVYPGNQ